MDNNSIYYAGAESAYRRNRAHEMWRPVRRSRRARAKDREIDRMRDHDRS